MNIDAGYKSDVDVGGTGGVISDSTGSFIVAFYCYFDHVVDAPNNGVYALREGLLLAQYIGCQWLIIHSNYLEVVDTMKQGGFSATEGAPIYDECWSYGRILIQSL